MSQLRELNEKILEFFDAYKEHMDSVKPLSEHPIYKQSKNKYIGEVQHALDFQAHLLTQLFYDVGSQRRQVIAQLQVDVISIFILFFINIHFRH